MISDVVSIFGGKGFIGSEYCKQFKNVYVQPRNDLVPKTNNILWFISTTDNYNVFGDTKIDVYTNIIVLLDMLNSAKRKFGNDFVVNFVSSWFVYGETELPAKEDALCNPKGFYAITKRTAEQMLISYCTSHQINYRILRLANVLGNDPKASLKKNAVSFILKEIAKGNPVKIYEQAYWREFIDLWDCVVAIHLIITNGLLDEIYNVGVGSSTNVKELFDYAKMICGNTKVDEIDTPEFHKQVQVEQFWMDITKLLELGFFPRYNIWDTVDKIINENK